MIEETKPLSTPRRGRPKGSHNKRTWFARDWADKCGIDPIEFMCKTLASNTVEVLKTDAAGKLVLDADGNPQREWAAVPMEVRLECAKTLARYMYPTLQATTISGPNDGPVNVTTLDIMAILKDPELACKAQELALLVSDFQIDDKGRRLGTSDLDSARLLGDHPEFRS